MKIRKIDRNRVVIEFMPVLIFVLAFIFFCVGLLVMAGFMQSATLECKREGLIQMCYYTHYSVLGETVKEIKVEDLKGAEVIESSSDDGDTYSVEIHTTNSSFGMTGISSSGYGSKEYIVGEINDFVNNTLRPTLFVEERISFIPLLIGGVFSTFGVLAFVLVSKISIYIDRASQQLTIVKKCLIRKTMQTYSFSEIDSAYVDESTSSDGSTYRVALELNNEKDVPLMAYYSSGYDSKKELADTINLYLENFAR